MQVLGGEVLGKGLQRRVRPAVQAEPDGRQAAPRLRAFVPAGQLPADHQHIRRRRNEALQIQPHAAVPGTVHVQRGFLDRQPLSDLQARLVGGQMQRQFADRLGARIRPFLVAGRRALAQFLHPLRIGGAARGLDRAASIRWALPAFDFDPVRDLGDMRRLGIIAQIEPPVPNVALAESPHDPVRGLIHADRQIAVAQQRTVFGRQHRLAEFAAVRRSNGLGLRSAELQRQTEQAQSEQPGGGARQAAGNAGMAHHHSR